MLQNRDNFSSKFAVIAAAAGSAIGLGNIWRFPYVLGENGGGAFLLVYLLFTLAIGIPLMVAEFAIGRRTERGVFGAFRAIAPKYPFFKIIGGMGILASLLILGFYAVVAGWTIEYTLQALLGNLNHKTPEEISLIYNNFSTSVGKPLLYMLLFLTITAVIVTQGVKKGIEKSTKVLMPLLLGIIIVLCINSNLLEGASKGLTFLFKPDFSKITGTVILEALGQAFFSLSIGMGVMITYGSYIQKKENLLQTAVSVSMTDTLIAILAGVAIFPAVFAFGINPESGPGLVFVTLPNIFNQMAGGYIFSVAFFLLLFIAALTSSVSLLEVVVACLTEELKMERKKATWLSFSVFVLFGTLCTLFPVVFSTFDFTSSNILLPLGGIFISIFSGWFLDKKILIDELDGGKKSVVTKYIIFVLKYLAPIAIAAVFFNNLNL